MIDGPSRRADWFNNRRLLGPIGNIPPPEVEENFYAQRDLFDMALDRPLGSPNTRAVIACLVSQEHDDLLAHSAVKATLGAIICYATTHSSCLN